MAAHFGNKTGLAIKDPKIRQLAFQSLCHHLASGKSIRSWWYDDENCACHWQTMLSYIKNNPDEFDTLKKDIAETKGFHYWESVVADSATGKNKDANTASLQMLMRNKYGWDKKESSEDDHNVLNEIAKLVSNKIKSQPQVSE